MSRPCECRDLDCPAHLDVVGHAERAEVRVYGPGLTGWLVFRVCTRCAAHLCAGGVILPAIPEPIPAISKR